MSGRERVKGSQENFGFQGSGRTGQFQIFSRELGFPVTWWNRLVLKVLKRAGFPVIPFKSMEEPEFLTEIE